MLVLDTDHLSLLGRPETPIATKVIARLDVAGQSTDVASTIVTYDEQTRGWLAYVTSTREPGELVLRYARLHANLDAFCKIRLLPFDNLAKAEFGRLQSLRLGVGTMDLRIAAIALSNRATLLSRNLRDFRKAPGLAVQDWTA